MSHPVGFARVCRVVITVWAVLSGSLLVAERASAQGTGAAESSRNSTLCLVVRVKGRTPARIKSTMLKGAELSGQSLADSDVEVRPVFPAFYEMIARHAGGGQANDELDGNKPVRIYRLPASAPTWSMSFANSDKNGRLIKSLSVKFAGNQAPLELTPKPVGPNDRSWIVAVVPGREYSIRLPDENQPESYTMVYHDPQTGQEKKEENTPWPDEGDPYYLVTMRNFRGDLDKLFSVIKEPTEPGANALVADPFKDIRRDFDVRLYLGSMNTTLPNPTAAFIENRMILNESPLSKRATKRVWVHFPIAESEFAKAVDEFGRLDPEQLPTAIRKDPARHVLATDGVPTVGASTGAKWYELLAADGKGTFEREIKLQGWKELQEKYPRAYQIVVWEFDDGKTRQAIYVGHQGREAIFKAAEIEDWPGGLESTRRFEQKADGASAPK